MARVREPRFYGALVRHVAFWLLISMLVITAPLRVSAQETRPALDPSRLMNELDTMLKLRERRESSTVPVAAPALSTPGSPERSGKRLFKLRKIIVEGAAAISPESIDSSFASLLGNDVTAADLSDIARSVSELYRAQGYHLSRAIFPPQNIENGTIKLQVIEGRFVEVQISGKHSSHANAILAAVTREEIARLATLERSLLLVNDTPGHRIADTQIEEIGTASGRFRLSVRLESWNLSTAFGVDNFGVPAVGRLLSYFSTALHPSFKAGDALRLNVSTVPNTPREMAFGQLWYDAPLDTEGTRLGILAAYGEVHPSDERRLRGTTNQSEILELQISTTPLRTRKSSLWFTASLAVQNFSEEERNGAIYRDRLRTIGLRGSYQEQDVYNGWHQIAVGWRQGLDLFGASDGEDALLSRSDASPIFSRFDVAYSRIQKLNDHWSYRLAAAGQWSSSPLLASQEFNVGGRAFGLGFDSGFIGGDQGIGANLELRYDHPLQNNYFIGYQLFAFLDGGSVRDIRAGGNWIASVASAGGGARIYFKNDLEAEIGIAFPVAKSESLGISYEPRIFFSVVKSFKTCLSGWTLNTCS
jgi:hemolysin activation/secretion protein